MKRLSLTLFALIALLSSVAFAAPFVTVDSAVQSRVVGSDLVADRDGDGLDSSIPSGATEIVVLDLFDYATIPTINTAGSTPETRLLWNQYEGDFTEGPDPGTEQTSTNWALFGTRSLNINVTGGNIYMQMYNYDNYAWLWMRDQITAGTWQYDTLNRLKFYLKVPAGEFSYNTGGVKNFTFGTYIREENGATNSAEAGGGHFYHNYNLKSLDANSYWQIEVDWHVNYDRASQSGSMEQGSKQYVTGDAGRNYFDQMTRFYMEFDGGLTGYPADFYIDGIHLYTAPSADNIDQIYSVASAYVASTNELNVVWSRRKDQDTQHYDIRYSFSDIHASGWESSTPAPNGTNMPPLNAWDYETFYWSDNTIDVTGQDRIYLAIKPVGSNDFRQVVVALNSNGLPDLGGIQ